jgi:hypothetical protein
MNRIILAGFAALLTAGAVRPPASASPVQTWTGWFSDQQCARAPRADETIVPNGTECVKQCLLKGSAAVFLSEQTNAIYKVLDHPGVRDDVGYRVEIAVAVDEKAKTVSIRSVKRLSEVTAMCLLPKKRAGN